MEWKRTARNIAGNRMAFPVQNRLNRSIQISAGYSFARAIMEKYQMPENEYGALSVSFVYLDMAAGQAGSGDVTELVTMLTVLHKLRVSVLNQSYEKKYYYAVNMRCEQLLAALEQNLCWQETARGLRTVWKAIREELPGESRLDIRERRSGLIGERLRFLGAQAQARMLENAVKAGALSRSRGGGAGERKSGAGFPGGGNGPGAQASVLSAWKSRQASRFFWRLQRASWWERQAVLEASGAGSLLELMKRLKPLEGEAWRRSFSRLQEQVESRLEDSEFVSRLMDEAAERGIAFPFPAGGPQAFEGIGIQERTKGPESRVEPEALTRLKELLRLLIRQEGAGAGAKSREETFHEEMKRDGTQELLVSLLEQGRILELLGGREEEDWIGQAREAVSVLSPEEWQTFKKELLEGSVRQPEGAGQPDGGSAALGWLLEPEQSAEAAGEKTEPGIRLEEAERAEAGENRPEPEILTRLKEHLKSLIWQEDAGADAKIREEILAAGAKQDGRQELSASLLERRQILEFLEGREEESWIGQAREAVSVLSPEEWQTFKKELLENSVRQPGRAGQPDGGSTALGWLLEPQKDLEAEKKQVLEAVSEAQRYFQESVDGPEMPGSGDPAKWLREEIRTLRNRLTAEHVISGELAVILNEGIRRLEQRKMLERCCSAVMEAVSYLGIRQWEEFKQELISAEKPWDEIAPSAVFVWLREERRREAGDGTESAQEAVAEEKRRFFHALMKETESGAASERQTELLFGQVFAKSRVLSEYISQDEDSFRAFSLLHSPARGQVPVLEGRELSAVLSSLAGEEWERLLRKLPAIERERKKAAEGSGEAVRELRALFRELPEAGTEAELKLQKQRALQFLRRHGSEEGPLGEILEKELRRLSISGRSRSMYQSLTEAASCMTLEEWETFRKETEAAIREEAKEKDIMISEAPKRKWPAGRGEGQAEGNERGERSGRPEGQAEAAPDAERLQALMGMSEEKQEFLRLLAGRLFLQETLEPEERQEEAYGRWERIFKKSTVLSRYVSWEETGTQAVKRDAVFAEEALRRLTVERWDEFKRGMEDRLSRTLLAREERQDAGFREAGAVQERLADRSGREASGILALRKERGYFREFTDRCRKAVEELFSVPSPSAAKVRQKPLFQQMAQLAGEERGPAAAVRLLETLRQSRIQFRVPAGEMEAAGLAYGAASLVIAQSGAARDNNRKLPEAARQEIKREVTKQTAEQTADIRFMTGTQAVRQEETAESRMDLKQLIRQVEEQQRELEALQRRQEAEQPKDLSQLSKAVMKHLQGELQMERLRHGR